MAVIIFYYFTMLVTVFILAVSKLFPPPPKLWSKANEVYIQNLISIEYTNTDWLSIVLVITIIRSGKQIGSKLPENGVCIEIVLNSASLKKKKVNHSQKLKNLNSC